VEARAKLPRGDTVRIVLDEVASAHVPLIGHGTEFVCSTVPPLGGWQCSAPLSACHEGNKLEGPMNIGKQ